MPKTQRDDDLPPLEGDELRVRTLYAFIQASAELSTLFGVGLKAFERLGHMAAFHVLRRRNFDLNEIASRLDVSRRKVDQLSRQLKDNFFQRFVGPDDRDLLERRIEFILWAQPISASRLKQVLKDTADEDIQAALDSLVSCGRLSTDSGLYGITTPERRLVRDDWLARIAGLNHQLRAVSAAAIGRFVDNDPHAFTRTVSMRARPERVQELEALYQEQIWPLLAKLDADCADAPADESVKLTFSVCWGPEQD